jgi:hypothetical protein
LAIPGSKVTPYQERIHLSKMAEIGTRVLWTNFVYEFGGEYFLQMEGGPIGARITMAGSRLVMQEWAEGYREVLDKSGVTRDAHKGYVDDGRQITDLMIRGSRYEKSRKRFIWREDWESEDELENLPDEVRMGRICLEAMNDVSPDLTFTVETVHDFDNKRLATLDFEAEVVDCQTHGCPQIIYSYFEKSMKTSLVIAEASAMGEHQKFSILTNEVIRRLSNTSKDRGEGSHHQHTD